jgi:hypothetical protein
MLCYLKDTNSHCKNNEPFTSRVIGSDDREYVFVIIDYLTRYGSYMERFDMTV